MPGRPRAPTYLVRGRLRTPETVIFLAAIYTLQSRYLQPPTAGDQRKDVPEPNQEQKRAGARVNKIGSIQVTRGCRSSPRVSLKTLGTGNPKGSERRGLTSAFRPTRFYSLKAPSLNGPPLFQSSKLEHRVIRELACEHSSMRRNWVCSKLFHAPSRSLDFSIDYPVLCPELRHSSPCFPDSDVRISGTLNPTGD